MRNRIIMGVSVLLALAVIVGCEWGGVTDDVGGGSGSSSGSSSGSTSSGSSGSSSSGSSGTSSGGGTTTTTTVPGGGTTTTTVPGAEVVVRNELIATGVTGKLTAYTGVLDQDGIVPGSVTVAVGSGMFLFHDDGDGNLVGEEAGTAGRINYTTGAWGISFGGTDIPNGTQILASYAYLP